MGKKMVIVKKPARELQVGDIVLEFVSVSALNAEENGLESKLAMSTQILILDCKPVFKTNKLVITYEPVNKKEGTEPAASLVDEKTELYIETHVEVIEEEQEAEAEAEAEAQRPPVSEPKTKKERLLG